MTRSIVSSVAGVFRAHRGVGALRARMAGHVVDPGRCHVRPPRQPTSARWCAPDYGGDELYTAMPKRALTGWELWNARWGESLYHQDGFLLLSGARCSPAGSSTTV